MFESFTQVKFASCYLRKRSNLERCLAFIILTLDMKYQFETKPFDLGPSSLKMANNIVHPIRIQVIEVNEDDDQTRANQEDQVVEAEDANGKYKRRVVFQFISMRLIKIREIDRLCF